MTKDVILQFGPAKKDSIYAITKRRVRAEMRDKWRDPKLNEGDCISAYELEAVKAVRDHITTLAALGCNQSVLGLHHYIHQATKHLRVK